ncbi:MAG: hypothetical protein WBA76_02825 [Phormidesmis sp.]
MSDAAVLTVQRFVKKLTATVVSLLLGVAMVLGFMQPAAQAAITESIGNPETTITGDSVDQLRANRRAINSQASRAASDEAEAQEKTSSLGEVINEKLNLDEIREDNVLVDDARDALDLDAPYEIPRRSN